MLVPDSPRDIWHHNNNSPRDPDFIVTALMTRDQQSHTTILSPSSLKPGDDRLEVKL